MQPHIVIMGVAGCGKTTIGQMLAERRGMPFADGDDYHPEANVQKMSEGNALTDEDRWPWLDALNALLKASSTSMVVSCSALRQAYRDRLAQGLEIQFVYLKVSEATVLERVRTRQHFFPASLVRDQFAILEAPQDENHLEVDGHQSKQQLLREICRQLDLR